MTVCRHYLEGRPYCAISIDTRDRKSYHNGGDVICAEMDVCGIMNPANAIPTEEATGRKDSMSGSVSDADLFEAYKGGAMPPLVAKKGQGFGLINGRLLEIYQLGFGGIHNISLGILLPNGKRANRWNDGDYHYNSLTRRNWTKLCSLIRSHSLASGRCPADQECEKCDRDHATEAEAQGRALAYLCSHGMIDFAVPVRVENETVAMLFSGQLRPLERHVWPLSLVKIPRELPLDKKQFVSGGAGTCDLRALSDWRIKELSRYGIPERDVESASNADVGSGRRVFVTPDDVREIVEQLNTAASLLSELATNTFTLQKLRLSSLLRFEFARALTVLDDKLSNIAEAFREMQKALSHFVELMGLDYAVLFNVYVQRQHNARIAAHILCCDGLDGILDCRQDMLTDNTGGHANSRPILSGGYSTIHIVNLSEGQTIPVLRELHEYYRSSGYTDAFAICVEPKETPGYILLIGKHADGWHERLTETDRQLTVELASVATLVCEVVCLLGDVHRSQEAMDRFMEDVAHDIRAPIQDVITKAALIKRATLSSDEFRRQAKKLSAAVMRIDLIARRMWTVQRLQRGELTYREGGSLAMDEVIHKVVDALADFAESEGVEVVPVWDEILKVPALRVDKEIFFEVVLNLVHNAIKYSVPIIERQPQVIIRSYVESGDIVFSVGNRGIPIRGEEAARIFDRYYRTGVARRFKPDGTGIGLSIVKDFVTHYGGQIDIESTLIAGTSDYLTIFRLRLRGRS